jgi:hypothetical protein
MKGLAYPAVLQGAPGRANQAEPVSHIILAVGRCRRLFCGLSLLIDQYRLLPSARRFVGAMNAACPAARPLFPLQQFLKSPRNAALARGRLFRVIDPADELIPANPRQFFPQCKNARLGADGRLQIIARFVDCAMRERVGHVISNNACRQKKAAVPSLTAGQPNVHDWSLSISKAPGWETAVGGNIPVSCRQFTIRKLPSPQSISI